MCVFCALPEDVKVTWLYGYRRVEYGGGETEREGISESRGGVDSKMPTEAWMGDRREEVHNTNTR